MGPVEVHGCQVRSSANQLAESNEQRLIDG
jgi:hypothetical protein